MSSDRAAKRPRNSFACQNCRGFMLEANGQRKLSCSGGRPCDRCRQDGRECVDADQSGRTPLTRQRMTELEERLAEYENLWQALHPEHPLESVRKRILVQGFEQTVQDIRGAPQVSFHNPVPLPVHTESTLHQVESLRDAGATEVDTELQNDPRQYPPTRPGSPRALALGVTFDLHPASHGNEWNEEHSPPETSPQDLKGATPSNDFGTGVRGGVGFMGLSSAATLLRAIQKLAPVNDSTLPASGEGLGGVASSPTSATWDSVQPSTSSLPSRSSVSALANLPPANQIRPLVDYYFHYFHALHPLVHEPTVRAQITGALPLPRNSGSRVLLYMIFATGAYEGACDDDANDDGYSYYEIARAALQQDLFAEGSLVLIQGLAIMALYLQRRNKPNAGYVCLGLAIRMAMALGLHVSAPAGDDTGLTVLESEMRSRVWWVLVTLEAGMCMTFGRPHGIPLPSLFAVRLPVNVDDEHLTVSTLTRPSDVQYVTPYSALITQARLAQMAFHTQDRISRSLPSPSVDQVRWCGEYFKEKIAALPPYAREPTHFHAFAQSVQIWRARDYWSIVYRPLYLSAAWSAGGFAASDDVVCEIVEICRTLASQNLQEIGNFLQHSLDHHRGCEWYALYYGIQASLTILLSIVCEPYHPKASSWRSQISETTAWLRKLRSMKQLGTSYAHIMETLLAVSPAPQPEVETPGDALTQRSDGLATDVDTFDFERYFSEIWNGQAQTGGPNGEMFLAYGADFWEDMAKHLANNP